VRACTAHVPRDSLGDSYVGLGGAEEGRACTVVRVTLSSSTLPAVRRARHVRRRPWAPGQGRAGGEAVLTSATPPPLQSTVLGTCTGTESDHPELILRAAPVTCPGIGRGVVARGVQHALTAVWSLGHWPLSFRVHSCVGRCDLPGSVACAADIRHLHSFPPGMSALDCPDPVALLRAAGVGPRGGPVYVMSLALARLSCTGSVARRLRAGLIA
jgi:hypothetical protein